MHKAGDEDPRVYKSCEPAGEVGGLENVGFGCWNANQSLRLGGLENVSVHCEMERRPCRNSSGHLRSPHRARRLVSVGHGEMSSQTEKQIPRGNNKRTFLSCQRHKIINAQFETPSQSRRTQLNLACP